MKAAFVLGLAVAANAQVDNEFVGYNPSGANIVRDAGWSQSHPSGVRTPIDYNTKYLNNYGLKHDDAADDELVGYNPSNYHQPTPHRTPIDYNAQYLAKYGLKHDDAADDEMMVYYTKDSRGVKHYEGGYTAGVRRDDAADDEMMVYYTKDSRGVKHYEGGVRRDDAADEELFSSADLAKISNSRPIGYRIPIDYNTQYLNKYGLKHDDVADSELVSGADLVKNAGWGRSLPVGYRTPVDYNTQYLNKYGLKHDATDDELMVYYTKDSRGVKHYEGGYTAGVRRDDAADDEMMVYYTKDSRGVNQYQGGYTRRDDAADDELVQTFNSPSGADLVKYAKQSQQTVYRPAPAYVVKRDDNDDELAVLGHLIKETQPEKVEKKTQRKFRHAEKN